MHFGTKKLFEKQPLPHCQAPSKSRAYVHTLLRDI